MLTITIYTGATPAAPPAAIRYIQSGVDGLGSTSFQLATQDVADWIGWLNAQVGGFDTGSDVASRGSPNHFFDANQFDNITATGTTKYKLASRSITRVAQAIGNANNGTDWTVGTDGTWTQVTTNGGAVAVAIPIDVPNGATLTSVTVEVKGAGAHAGAPGLLPIIELHTISTAGVSFLVANASDTYPSAGVYQAAHAITINSAALGGGIVADKTTLRYVVTVNGEGGANYVAGLKVYTVSWTATVTAQDDGAA